MKNKLIKIYSGLFMLMFLFPTFAISKEQILYCTETAATGYKANESGKEYSQVNWKPSRFTMKVNFQEMTLETEYDYQRSVYHDCIKPGQGDMIMCYGSLNAHITYSQQYMRFTSHKAHEYIFTDDFPISGEMYFAYGECE